MGVAHDQDHSNKLSFLLLNLTATGPAAKEENIFESTYQSDLGQRSYNELDHWYHPNIIKYLPGGLYVSTFSS